MIQLLQKDSTAASYSKQIKKLCLLEFSTAAAIES